MKLALRTIAFVLFCIAVAGIVSFTQVKRAERAIRNQIAAEERQ